MKYITFTSHEISTHVVAKLAGPVKIVSHHSEGWQQIQRMWRYSFTEWQGAPGYEIDIPILFDQFNAYWSHGQGPMASVESQVLKMDRLIEKLPEKPRTPIMTIDAHGAVPHDHTNDPSKLWVIGTVDWADDYILNSDDRRCRQAATVNVFEWIPDKVTQAKNLIPTKPVPRTYRIKKGDTLIKIAVFFYGDGSKWRDISKLNHIRHPNHPRVGMTIKLPRPS